MQGDVSLKPIVAVIGGSRATPEELAAAEAVGRALAECGALLVCGGRGGVMEAACRGAKAGGGLTLGILPGVDRSQANAYVDIALPTGIGEARNAIVVRSAQAVVAIGGSYGTLSEIAFALSFRTPVVGVMTWHAKRAGHRPVPIRRIDDPQQAAALAIALAKGE